MLCFERPHTLLVLTCRRVTRGRVALRLLGERTHPALELVGLGDGLLGSAPVTFTGADGILGAARGLIGRRLGRGDPLPHGRPFLLELLRALGERLQLLLGLGGAAALVLRPSGELLGATRERLPLPLELADALLGLLRSGLRRLNLSRLIRSLPRHLVGAPLVLGCGLARGGDGLPLLFDGLDELLRTPVVLPRRLLRGLDGALVPALEVGDPRLELRDRLLRGLARLAVGLARLLQLARCTLALPRGRLGLHRSRALVDALSLELLEPASRVGSRGFCGLDPALHLVPGRLGGLLELGCPRAGALERAASLVALRGDLRQPARPLLRLAPRRGERPLDLAGGLRLVKPALQRSELRLQLSDPRLAGGDVRLGGDEPRPLLLELRLELGERDVAGEMLEDLLDAAVAAVRLRLRGSLERRAGGSFPALDRRAARRVPPLDLGSQAGPEALLGLQLDAVLLGERVRERGPGDMAPVDQDLAEPFAGRLLRRQRLLELLGSQQSLLDEECAKRAPRHVRRSHTLTFGSTAARLEPL